MDNYGGNLSPIDWADLEDLDLPEKEEDDTTETSPSDLPF